MPPKLKAFLLGWGINSLAVVITAYILSGGIHFHRPLDLIVAALLLGVLNAVVRPILMLLSLPLVLLTLGLFVLVINAFLLYLVSFFMQPNFQVDSFKYAFVGAALISLMNMVLNAVTGAGKASIHIRKGGPPAPPPDGPGSGSGPVIDV